LILAFILAWYEIVPSATTNLIPRLKYHITFLFRPTEDISNAPQRISSPLLVSSAFRFS